MRCAALLRIQQLVAMSSTRVRAVATAAESIEVICIDPRPVLQRNQDVLTDEKQFTRLKLPADFLSHIHKGTMELGDMDDPLNCWFFGQRDEIFKYRLMGTLPTMSGFMSFIEQQTLQHICDGSEAAGLPEWDDFKADLQAGLIHFPSMRTPFLFAGAVLDSPAAAVYHLTKDREVVGVAVSSEAGAD